MFGHKKVNPEVGTIQQENDLFSTLRKLIILSKPLSKDSEAPPIFRDHRDHATFRRCVLLSAGKIEKSDELTCIIDHHAPSNKN
jgi:hypothetical protein